MEKEAKIRSRNRERQAVRRAMETEKERSQRLEKNRKYSAEKRANESDEQKAERRLVDRKRAADRRARESLSEREQRLVMGRQRAAERRACETEEIRECRLAQNRERIASKRALKTDSISMSDGKGDVVNEVYRNSHHEVQPFLSCSASKAGQTCQGEGHTFQEAEHNSVAHPVADGIEMSTAQQQAGTVEQVAATSGGGGIGGGEEKSGQVKQEIVEIKEFRAVEPTLERHYNDLLKVISEIGRDVKPAYTNNKVSTDRLRKNIMMARGIVRECVQDVDRLSASSSGTSS